MELYTLATIDLFFLFGANFTKIRPGGAELSHED